MHEGVGFEPNIKTANIRGLTTAWLEYGLRSNPTVFFCHGFPDGPSAWAEQIEYLKSDYHVVAPFVRGCEHSETSNDLSRYNSHAILLDHLEILNQVCEDQDKPVFVVGHDLGVVHGMHLARALGKRLAGKIVINGTDIDMFGRRLRNPKQLGRSWYMGLMQIPWLPEAMVSLIPESCNWLASEIGNLPPKHRETVNFAKKSLGPLNQYRSFAREMVASKSETKKRISSPMLVFWGNEDGFLEPPNKEEWGRVGLNVTIRILPGGHWLHREKSAEVNPLMKEFIEKCFTRVSKEKSDESHS